MWRDLLPKPERAPAAIAAVATVVILVCLAVALIAPAFYLRWLFADAWSTWQILLLPLAWVWFGMGLSLVALAVRWTLLPRIPEGVFEMYSGLVIRWAIVHRLTHLTQSLFVGHFAGTPWVNVWFRALGARIGARVVLNSTDLTDWDLLSIGEGTFIGFRGAVQGHAGERDGVRFRRVCIGNHVQVGRAAMVFDGVSVGDGVILAPGSLAPPGKQLLGPNLWCGVPARRVPEPSLPTVEVKR